MAVVLAPNLTRRDYTWTAWKAVYASKNLPFQYDDDGTLYTIWTYDGPEIHVCQIYKATVPYSSISTYSQSQNDSDKTDFETNYKSLGNAPLSQIDTDGADIVRIKAAKRGWSFWAIPIELTTSLLSNNLYCKDSLGNDISGITYKIYDSDNVEITVPGLLNANLGTAVKTVIDFEPPFDYEIIGGTLRTNANIGSDVRLWIVGAPDIPAQYGGSKEFASGINLKFLAPDSSFEVDGRVTKFLTYNAQTHTNKMRIILKHPPGTQLNLQIVIHIYRA